MNKPVIEIKGVSKNYKITHQQGGYIALRDVIMNVLRSPFQFAKSKAKSMIGLETREEFWALKDINLTVNEGEVIGIIGHNGAGKSTLLKILSQITPPTEGEIIVRGKVGSLLEVGTGFNPELTGRENIFLNGAIIGMTRREIARKFDQIVEFAGVEKFLDTPVKYYSSGMYVRLAFSVAAHMEPDILLVDEVLAVGDAEFQKKCLGKMEEVSSAAGRTIIFISHNLSAVSNLCKKTVLLEKGRVKMIGDTEDVIRAYAEKYDYGNASWEGHAGDDSVEITRTYAKPIEDSGRFVTSAPIEIHVEGNVKRPTRDLAIGIVLYSEFGYPLAHVFSEDRLPSPAPEVEPGPFKKKFVIPPNSLAHGRYQVEIDVSIHNQKRVVKDEGKLFFTLDNTAQSLNRRFPDIKGQGYSSLFWPDWSTE